MLKVGLTGGIGSGKSLIAEMFKLLGVPVMHADATAKYLMEHDENLKAALTKTFGEKVYQNGRLSRPFLASLVFNNTQKLETLNALVHPATVAYSGKWFEKQAFPYAIKEAAIFFESGTYVEMNKMIGVYAPFEMRLKRTMERDGISEEEVKERMQHQMNEEEKMSRCDYVIQNDGSKSIIEQVLEIHYRLTSNF